MTGEQERDAGQKTHYKNRLRRGIARRHKICSVETTEQRSLADRPQVYT